MRKMTLALAILGTTLVPALYTAPAHAQATRTWVSGVGDDANPCSRTAPCKTFAGAISKTASPGEINCLDPGGFGAVTITKSITIDCRYTSNGGVLVAGTNAIVVAATATDKVQLIGLDFEGVGTGVDAVKVNSALEVIIDDCIIRDFATNGVEVTNSVANSRVVIKNSLILNNGTCGNVNTGGVNVASSAATVVEITDSLLEHNQNYGIRTNTGNDTVALIRSVVSDALVITGGNVISFGPSNVIGGATNPSATVLWK
jgi:hypothetical protein